MQFKQNKKSYCIDTGLRNAVAFKISDDMGRLAENIIFLELLRRKKDVFFWKDKKHHEVDFVINEGVKPAEVIQTCWNVDNEKTRQREIDGLLSAMETFNLKEGFILTEDFEETEVYDRKEIHYVSLWRWLLTTDQ